MLLLGLSMMFSCGQQRSKNNNATENQTIKSEIVSDGNDDRATEESSIPEVTSVDNDYKWLEGVWAAEDEESHESVKMIITDTYFQFNRGFTDAMNDRVEEQPKIVYSIETRYNVILEKEILSFDEDYDNIGVDVERRCPYVVLGEFSPILYLKKIEGQTTEEAVAKANQLKAQTIHGITDPASYTWADENLYGKVQSYEESTNNLSGYCVTKKFDNNGRMVYYHAEGGWILGYSIYPKGENLPILDKINANGSQTLNSAGHCHFILDHHLLNPIHMGNSSPGSPASFNSSYNYDNEITYKYNIDHITAIYKNNQLLYEFEYDIYGRVIKTLENGKPRIKITWSDYGDPQHVGYNIKFYSPEGYDGGEYRYAWKSKDILAAVKNNGKEDYYSYPEFTFYDFPQVKTVTWQSNRETFGTDCYFYDNKGHLIHVVSSNNKIGNYNIDGNKNDYFSGYCKSYKYNDQGDVYSATTATIFWPWNHRHYNEFINYLFRYDFNQLPASTEETIWRYEYDDHRNWTKRERYEVVHGDIDIENLKDITTRKYVYYE